MAWTGGPTSEITRCVLPLIASGRSGLDIVALAADVIAADARLNIWFADLKGRNVRQERWLELLEFFEGETVECLSAVRKYHEGGDRQELAEALSRIAKRLNQRPDPIR
jgi:hypothetical protein